MELLIERHAANGRIADIFLRGLWEEFDIERAGDGWHGVLVCYAGDGGRNTKSKKDTKKRRELRAFEKEERGRGFEVL